MMVKISDSADSTASRPPWSASMDAADSGVMSSATSCGSAGTVASASSRAASRASSSAAARSRIEAFAAAVAARSARCSAIWRVIRACTMTGPAWSISTFSAAISGAVMALNTGDLRAPGGRAVTVNRFTGSDQPVAGRTRTRTLPAHAVASSASATEAARSIGVCVSSATPATFSATHFVSASAGNSGRVPVFAPSGAGSVQPLCSASSSVAYSARIRARSGASSSSLLRAIWTSRIPEEMTRRA